MGWQLRAFFLLTVALLACVVAWAEPVPAPDRGDTCSGVSVTLVDIQPDKVYYKITRAATLRVHADRSGDQTRFIDLTITNKFVLVRAAFASQTIGPKATRNEIRIVVPPTTDQVEQVVNLQNNDCSNDAKCEFPEPVVMSEPRCFAGPSFSETLDFVTRLHDECALSLAVDEVEGALSLTWKSASFTRWYVPLGDLAYPLALNQDGSAWSLVLECRPQRSCFLSKDSGSWDSSSVRFYKLDFKTSCTSDRLWKYSRALSHLIRIKGGSAKGNEPF